MKKIFLVICLFASIASFGQYRKDQLSSLISREIKTYGAYSSSRTGKVLDSLVLSLESQKRAAGYIPVGNASGIAVDVPLSGDGLLSSAGSFTTTGLRGVTISSTSPTSNQVLQYNGSQWVPATISVSSTFQGLTDGPGSFSGKTLNFTRVNAGETALEYRTPTQVRSDIGAQSAISFGTGVQTALGVNIGSAGAPVLLNGAGGTPSSMTGTNITGVPLTTGVTGTLPVANGGTSQTTGSIRNQSTTISTNTFTLDFSSFDNTIFYNTTAITANFTIALSNTTNALSFEFKFKLNGTNLTMTCPNTFTSLTSDTNWNSSTQVYTFNGTLSNVYYNIVATYNTGRSKWEMVVSNADFQ